MRLRQIITTADDFGASPEVNEAVVQAHREGLLRFASLMVDAPAAEQAAEAALACRSLGVGVHLVLCAEDPAAWGLRLLSDREARAELEASLSGQVDRFLSFGLVPTHLDSHFNAHVHPAVLPAVLRLARRFAIPRVRWPAGELGPSLAYAWTHWRAVMTGSPVADRSPSPILRQVLLSGAYGALGLASRWRAGGGVSLIRAFGMLHSGMMTEDYVIWLLRRLRRGVTELYFHPSLEPSLGDGMPTPSHRSATELLTLLSPRVRQTLQEEGIQLLRAG
ncbi:MAG: ChbG/HpnK family deacetylase [Elusimicrobia bacterium]|nr:ChbG/HpnK family deacetylase [Elusimicrobiota bacterium]